MTEKLEKLFPCGHIFHTACLVNPLNGATVKKCPNCRTNIKDTWHIINQTWVTTVKEDEITRYINSLPLDTVVIEIEEGDLVYLPDLRRFSKLETLYCSNNQLSSLPPLPDSLRHLEFASNKLTSLPPLPDGLESLDCYTNQLTSLPPLPDYLVYLDCQNNKLTYLPKLPDRLKYLYCENNKLTSLPPLPDSLEELICKGNHFNQI